MLKIAFCKFDFASKRELSKSDLICAKCSCIYTTFRIASELYVLCQIFLKLCRSEKRYFIQEVISKPKIKGLRFVVMYKLPELSFTSGDIFIE